MTPQAYIFDLDDTLIETFPVYQVYKDRAIRRMSELGLDVHDAWAVLDEVERENIRKYGFSKERFPRSLVKVYGELCRRQGHTYDGYEAWQIEGMGWQLFEHDHRVLDHVKETLGALMERQPKSKLILCTKGDTHVQYAKAERAGLTGYFDAIEVVADKTVQTYLDLAAQHNLTPSQCYMIGDSIKSDVNPSAYAGFNAIWIEAPASWAVEVEEITDRHIKLHSIREVLGLQLAQHHVL